MRSPNSYTDGSVFTVKLVPNEPQRRHELGPLIPNADPNDASFDIAVLQFKDNGACVSSSQIQAAEACIQNARASTSNQNGALVVLFIHGWHHGAAWNRTPSTAGTDPDGDTHFHSFRLILESLTLREAERYSFSGHPAGRRVVGVFVGWNGDPENSFLPAIPIITHTTFSARYKVAETIGAHPQFRDSIRRIIAKTKEPIDLTAAKTGQLRPECPLVLMGHSMGSLMIQSAFASLLEDDQQLLERPRRQQAETPVNLRSGETSVFLPDLVLCINSAADSRIARRIIAALRKRSITKTVAAAEIKYSPPVLISATSISDKDTKIWWSIGKPGRSTDGHNKSLFTHTFKLTCRDVACIQANTLDFGQNWHCLRKPEPLISVTPAIPIDLPTRERKNLADRGVPHSRYVLAPVGPPNEPHVMWIFQVPPEIIKDHNDIFNSRARSLILGLIQISGAVASIAEKWETNFEP